MGSKLSSNRKSDKSQEGTDESGSMKARHRIVRAAEPSVEPYERKERVHRHPWGQVLDDEIGRSTTPTASTPTSKKP